MLIDDLHRVDRQAGDRPGDEIGNGRDLGIRQLSATRQAHHHRSSRRQVVAHEHGALSPAEMHADGLDPVDLHDRQRKVAFLRGAQAIAFERAAGAHRQRVEQLGPAFRRGQGSVGSDQHSRAVEIVLGHGQSASRVVDGVVDRRLVERADDIGPLGIAQR